MSKEVLSKSKEKMEKAEQALTRQLGTIRAGRANASLLDRLSVDYYGRLLQLTKWLLSAFLKLECC